jgi:hypothetical protein
MLESMEDASTGAYYANDDSGLPVLQVAQADDESDTETDEEFGGQHSQAKAVGKCSV